MMQAGRTVKFVINLHSKCSLRYVRYVIVFAEIMLQNRSLFLLLFDFNRPYVYGLYHYVTLVF